MFLKAKQIAQWIKENLHVDFTESTVRSWMHHGKIPSKKIGGKRGLHLSDVEKILPEFLGTNKLGGCDESNA